MTARVDLRRLEVNRHLEEGRRAKMGQFLTPAPVARLMASFFRLRSRSLRLLDPGAGVGSLSAAVIAALASLPQPPERVSLTAYELDSELEDPLRATLEECRALCRHRRIRFHSEIRREDFIEHGTAMLGGDLFDRPEQESFDGIIVNPPYRKIHTDSRERRLLRSIGIETTNLYTGFLAVALRLLAVRGQMVAITPRSFCNGPYFKPFRKLLLDTLILHRIHVFESRNRAFADDQVLQENIIFHGTRGGKSGPVVVSANGGAEDDYSSMLQVAYEELVQPGDPNRFIRLITDEVERQIARRMSSLHHRLEDLGLSVSTGPVVDFRARAFLRQEPDKGSAPLIYPTHFDKGFIKWPRRKSKKPNAIAISPGTEDLLVPSQTYVLTKRFSSKEERRRVVAAIFKPPNGSASQVGFENHLNYYHRGGKGLPRNLAKGLGVFLNSTLIDAYFRQFNGHTQVNASDLRSLRYPTTEQLEALGCGVGRTFPNQLEVDRLVEEVLFSMEKDREIVNPIKAKKKVEEALAALNDLGMPKEQQNERSALSLLALLDLGPNDDWPSASTPFCGITQMIEFFADIYGKKYAPNTRETIRKHSVHQFVQAGIAVKNPDDPERPTNSPKTVYQIAPIALSLLRSFGTREWKSRLRAYLRSAETLSRQYARERRMKRLPVRVSPGKTVTLSPGDHSTLVKKVLDDFCALFTPGASMIYVGDTEKKWAFFDKAGLATLGVRVEEHGKMPDVVIYDDDRNWLVLIEAVSTHGPIDAKRHLELKKLFVGAEAGLVFVTAFPDRKVLGRFLQDITWETEVWIADAPTHLIHFDGERFLGPIEDGSEI